MTTAASHDTVPAHAPWWVKELPFTIVLGLTIIGVAYTSYSKAPAVVLWEILAPMIGILCVAYGWHNAKDEAGRARLIGTQLLHWLAFLVVMNLLLVPHVQRLFAANAAALSIFTLLTLGTFTAGVHVLSWQICLLGLIMALGIPAIAWIENSALIVLLVGAGLLATIAVFWWRWRSRAK